jgi:glycosyltransferase involved in cell wall biosynthesis
MKIVSVIIPAKNESEYLGRCLESLRALEFPENLYEIIIADNGSTDDSVDIAHSFSAKVVHLDDALTISAVRNGGAAIATGKILVFLDADCTVDRDWLIQAKRYFGRTDIACFGSSPIIPNHPTWVERTWFLVRESHQQVFERQWQESTNMFIPKVIFEQVGGFNEKLITCEDVDLSYRLLKLGKIISDNRIIAIHHRDPKTIKEFFLKEKWRGKSNYSGLFLHGIKFDELPSLLLPIYFIGLLTGAILFLFLGFFFGALACFCIAQLPVMGIAWLKVKHTFAFGAYLRLSFLYNIYFAARALSIFPTM